MSRQPASSMVDLSHSFQLLEAAVAERVGREVELHPTLWHTPLIYEAEGAERLRSIYREYLDIAREAGVPILLAAPTWRLDAERVRAAGVPPTINTDAVHFLRELVGEEPLASVGGLLGPANDCYDPQAALDADAAESFHAPQARELAAAGVDYLLGQTLPAVGEAIGMARAALATGSPTLVSFCINPEGEVLDGTPVGEAMRAVDAATDGAVAGYLANCSYPTFLHPERIDPATRHRFIGFDANGSSRVPWELEDAAATVAEPVEQWAADMLALHREWGVRLLGGCCGTTGAHLKALVQSR